jgi:hypothetical protein
MISSKVWKGIERITQEHYEQHRIAKATPPNIVGQVPSGAIPYQADRISMKELRYWGKGLRFKVDGIEVSTALDDMLQRPSSLVFPASAGALLAGKPCPLYNVIDYKSKSKATDLKATEDLYQNQADVFDLAANVNDYPTDNMVYFDYWYPAGVLEGIAPPAPGDHGTTKQLWGSQIIAVKADHERCKKLVLAAAACIDGPMPEPNFKVVVGKKGGEKIEGCAVCAYIFEREKILKALAEGKQ